MELCLLHRNKIKLCINYTQLNTIVLLVLLSMQFMIDAATNRTKMQDYGIIIDAGSSGTRVRIYSWEEDTWTPGQVGNLPDIREIHSKKVKPGISSFAGNVTGLDKYLSSLIDEAKNEIPEIKHRETHIYLLATAGMRLLLEDEANHVMEAIDRFLLNRAHNPFMYDSLYSRILSGEEEGVFAWISVNYLRGFFNEDSEALDAGILELGGASAQIAFQHEGSILTDKFPVTIGGQIYPLYVHSYLGFGQEQVLAKTQELAVAREALVGGQRQNPCMLRGDNITATVGDARDVVHFLGTGDPTTCLEYMQEIVYEPPDEDRCLPKPCAIGTVYQPSIRPDTPFYAISAFVFALKTLDVLDTLDKSFTIRRIHEEAQRFCSLSIAEAEQELERFDDIYNSIECMIGLYTEVLLDKGFGFETNSSQIHAANSINDEKIEWTLGALIYETERHQIECEEKIIMVSGTDSFLTNTYLSSFVIVLVMHILLLL